MADSALIIPAQVSSEQSQLIFARTIYSAELSLFGSRQPCTMHLLALMAAIEEVKGTFLVLLFGILSYTASAQVTVSQL